MNVADLINMGFVEADIERAISISGSIEGALEYLLHGNNIAIEEDRHMSLNSPLNDAKITILPFSQYDFQGGESACTAISAVVMSNFLTILEENNSFDDLHNENMLCDLVMQGVCEYNSFKTSDAISQTPEHLSAEDVYRAPTLAIHTNIAMIGEQPIQHILSSEAFLSTFNDARKLCAANSSKRFIGIIITKPPETIFVIIRSSESSAVNGTNAVLFDSHSRPQLGISGSYLLTFETLLDLNEHLCVLFPSLNTGNDDGLMSTMYNSFDCTIFQKL
jgi:hypothetical protein